MCGIAALFGHSNATVPFRRLRAMCDAVKHRGPDGEGYAVWNENDGLSCWGGPDTPPATFAHASPGRPARLGEGTGPSFVAGVGHRRLAIIDLSPTGHQPMVSADGRRVIVFNGEIYNHEEVREDLRAKGHVFRGRSDTEVVLNAFAEWGPDCLKRFNGMFAFLVFSPKERRVFAARDRFGVKPCYFWVSPAGFTAFGSEIKQFTTLEGWAPVLHLPAAHDFLAAGVSDHRGDTFFQGVKQLRGGEYLECALDDVRAPENHLRTWYAPPQQPVTLAWEEATARFRTLFESAVGLRLNADVPVGTGLSGGLDSSSVVCVADTLRRGRTDPHYTFSACSENPRFDERRFIQSVVRATRTEPRTTFPTLGGYLKELPAVVWHQDEPFGGSTVYAEYSVFREVRHSPVKVTLDGHGADELLAGYHSFFPTRLAGLIRAGRWAALVAECRELNRRHGIPPRVIVGWLARGIAPASWRARWSRRWFQRAPHRGWWSDEARRASPEGDGRDLGWRPSSVAQQSWTQLFHSSLPMQLRWSDRDSMAHGIESRAPFLDYRLVEFSLNCPEEFKIARGITKRILREALRSVLPPEVAQRVDKMGFVTPEEVWVRTEAPEEFLDRARAAVRGAAGCLTAAAVRRAEDIVRSRGPYDPFLMRLVVFGEWMRVFRVGVGRST